MRKQTIVNKLSISLICPRHHSIGYTYYPYNSFIKCLLKEKKYWQLKPIKGGVYQILSIVMDICLDERNSNN